MTAGQRTRGECLTFNRHNFYGDHVLLCKLLKRKKFYALQKGCTKINNANEFNNNKILTKMPINQFNCN